MSGLAPQAAAPVAPARPGGARADLHALLAALVKVALVGEGGQTDRWRAAAREAQPHVAREAEALAALHFDDVWVRAVKEAEADPDVRRTETANPTLPMMAPIGLEQLAHEPFDLDAAVQAIRDVASFG